MNFSYSFSSSIHSTYFYYLAFSFLSSIPEIHLSSKVISISINFAFSRQPKNNNLSDFLSILTQKSLLSPFFPLLLAGNAREQCSLLHNDLVYSECHGDQDLPAFVFFPEHCSIYSVHSPAAPFATYKHIQISISSSKHLS